MRRADIERMIEPSFAQFYGEAIGTDYVANVVGGMDAGDEEIRFGAEIGGGDATKYLVEIESNPQAIPDGVLAACREGLADFDPF